MKKKRIGAWEAADIRQQENVRRYLGDGGKRDIHAAEREKMRTCPRCQDARRQIAERGFRVSDVPDHGSDFCAAQSIETCGAATFNHPRAYVQVRAHPTISDADLTK